MPATPVLGQIMPFAGTVVPRGWAICNGALIAIQTNQALFSLIGTYYGGNGTTNFGLPDLQGRTILGASNTIVPGTKAGEVNVTLLTAQLPAHNHLIQASTTQGAGRASSPLNNLFGINTEPASNPKKIFLTAGTSEVNTAINTNVLPDGGGLPHNNMQPYLAISYLIALQGIYPSRN